MAHLLRWLGPLVLAGSMAGCGNAANDQPKIPFATHLTIVANPHAPPDAFYLPNPVQVHVGQIISWTNRATCGVIGLFDILENESIFSRLAVQDRNRG